MSMYSIYRLSRSLLKPVSRYRKTAAAVAFAMASASSYAADVALDGSRTLEAGTDCQVGAIYRFGTSSTFGGNNLDVLVEILGEQNDFVSVDPNDNDAAQCVGFHHPSGVTLDFLSFWGEDSATDDDDGDGTSAGEPFYMDLRISVVQQGTNTVEPLDFMTLNLIDLDTASGVATDDVNLIRPDDIYHAPNSEVVVTSTYQLGDSGEVYTNKFRGKASGECGDTTNTVDQTCVISNRFAGIGTMDVRVGNDHAGAARLVQMSLEEGAVYQTPYNNLPVVESKVIDVEEGDAPTNINLALPTDPGGDPMTVTIDEIPAVGTVTLADTTPVTVGHVGLTPTDIAGLIYEAPASYDGSDMGQFIYRVNDVIGFSVGVVDFTVSSDGDGIPNGTDIDDDNDGIPDTEEGSGVTDTDGDGVVDSLDLDSDNDGISDLVESGADFTTLDTDQDGQIDSSFTVGTNGLADAVETAPDAGQADYDGDGTPDTPQDSDADGIDNYRDLDSDDDSINDIVESDGVDANGNAMVDNFTDANDNGYSDDIENNQPVLVDTDGDSVVDYLDLDSDNDGVPDVDENGAKASDPDNDGRVDGVDFDSDGIHDAVDGDAAVFGDAQDNGAVDSDGDGVPDFRDLDSDNDSINDIIEADGTDSDGDALVDGFTDTNGDGLDDDLVSAPFADPNTDSTDGEDRIDTDSNDDATHDIVDVGNGTLDGNSDGVIDTVVDADADGIADSVDGDTGSFGDAPATTDSDADGISDSVEGIADSDGDTIPDYLDIDSDNDGITDAVETAADFDGDTIPNYLDIDADGDGIVDLEESGLNEASQNLLDSDADGVIDAAQNFGANGLANGIETSADSGSPDYDADGTGDAPVDTDGDSHPDFLDLDADDDGIPDVYEADVVDANTDGMADSDTPTQDPTDTDGDGIADYRDIDADNDGIPDVVEAGGVDSDNNGRVDNAADTDNDGWKDAVSPVNGGTALPIPDTDGDGVDDFRDLDSDGDGIPDVTEAYGLPDTDGDQLPDDLTDANGDGRPDVVAALGDAPADADGNGIPDYLEDSDARIETGLDGHGGGAFGGAGLMTLALLAAWRRKRLVKPVTLVLSASLLTVGVANADGNFKQRFYGGGSVVISDLEPDTNTTGYGVSETGSSGFSLNAGYDISPHWTAEIYYTDLGEAEIDRNSDGSVAGDIAYQHAGISAIGYAWNMEDGFGSNGESLSRREGLSAYGRVGLGLMDNSTDLPYERLNDIHLHLGGGLEYGFENGLAARAEVISYDTDAVAMQLGVIKRFGEAADPVMLGNSDALPKVERVALKPVAKPLPAPIKPSKKVQKVVVKLPYVFFATGKADLTAASVKKLNILAATLRKYPALKLLVNGHTDSIDDDRYNLALSLRRAATVKRYLATQGIEGKRLQTQAFGETSPVSTNGSAAGRAQNRRVEFKIIQPRRK